MEQRMTDALRSRADKGTIRHLPADPARNGTVRADEAAMNNRSLDFSSNDYLGLAHDIEQHQLVESEYREETGLHSSPIITGATGSRLLSGDATYFHQLETYLARVHHRPAALIFNSGYDANLSVVSCLPCDVIVYDEIVHNSLHMGMRLWLAVEPDQRRIVSFQHNSVDDMREKLRNFQTNKDCEVVVLIESVYSMDGDIAPVKTMLDVADEYGAKLIVDEAHGIGVYGRATRTATDLPGTGVVAAEDAEQHPALLCTVFTFGKAAGCHGAVACFQTQTHKDYIVNYGYPFIYSTALPLHSLVAIKCSYESMTGVKGDSLRKSVFELVDWFHAQLGPFLRQYGNGIYLIPSTSPIQALVVPGNQECTHFCELIFKASGHRIRLFPIKSPTVPAGQERVRIIIHSHNTKEEVNLLVKLIMQTLKDISNGHWMSRL